MLSTLLLALLSCLPMTDGEPLERGLNSIVAAKIRPDLYFVASDELRGRATGSTEQRIVARFIQARLQRLGFQPGNGDKFLYEYPLETRTLDRTSLMAEVVSGGKRRVLVYGQDYLFPGTYGAAARDLEAQVMYCGAEEFPAEVKGKWALCVRSKRSLFSLRRRAERAGAAGLLVVAPEQALGQPAAGDPLAVYAGKDAPLFDLRLAWPDASRAKPTDFPICALGEAAAAELIGEDKLTVGTTLTARFHDRRSLQGEGLFMAENVVGFWPGSDPDLADEVLIVSAHYDHLGAHGGKIFNGADDNGSGTSGLLALAEALAEYGPMRRSVLLIWVSGEELGLWGSKAWVMNPSLPEGAKAVANVNIDMIGRTAPAELYVTPSSKHKGYNGLSRRAGDLVRLEGFGELQGADAYYRRSDQAEFAKLGIPVCFLFAGEHEDYHKATDTAEKIDYDKIRRTIRVVLRLLDSLQDDELDL